MLAPVRGQQFLLFSLLNGDAHLFRKHLMHTSPIAVYDCIVIVIHCTHFAIVHAPFITRSHSYSYKFNEHLLFDPVK